jgi:hypothetical protein
LSNPPCTPNSSRAFQWYQELGKRHEGLGNLNTTKQTTFSQIDRQTILRVLKPSKITIITWQFEINYIICRNAESFFKEQNFVKENKAYFGLFRNILHGISKINYSRNMC